MATDREGKPAPPTYLAHSANNDGAGISEPLRVHLEHVAQQAAQFARPFGADQQARAAGLLHDLGKYADRFLQHLISPHRRAGDHWSAGACLLAAQLGTLGLLPAVAVAGHHAGLDDLPAAESLRCWANQIAKQMQEDRHAPEDQKRFTETNIGPLYNRYRSDGLTLPTITEGLVPTGFLAADMLDARMLFSALVDADFLETEAHFCGDVRTPRRPRPPGPSLDATKAIDALERHLEHVRSRFRNSPMTTTRQMLLEQCIAAANEPQGLFALSAPTGAGKTLAMLAFALHHARQHNLRRIILVIPFLNIIEQTAGVYHSIFSPANGFADNTVLEHHSLVEYGEAEDETGGDDSAVSLSRLLSENWDAPIVLTTTVQFFESLMAARPGRCRKLHRLARSVILFDEVQTLPVSLAVATLATLSRLADRKGPYGTTVLFATATQPEFAALDRRVREFAPGGWQPREVIADPAPLYRPAATRVRVQWRHRHTIDLEQAAEELKSHDRVLCIVNLKRHAARLAELLAESGGKAVLHLSTYMCPAHRQAVLAKVTNRLERGLPVRLVATQCVEAGVDLDFPVVYRALAPLEALAQAAGRCNRHGQGRTGRVVVFKPRDERGYPPGYEEAVQATESFLALLAEQEDLDGREILNDPAALRHYFRHLYHLSGRSSTGPERSDEQELLNAIRAGDFQEVAKLYRLIRVDSINVVVRYDQERFAALRREITEPDRLTPELVRRWIRRATPYAVGLFRPRENSPIWNHLEPVQFSRRHPVENYQATWFWALPGIEYGELTGISVGEFDLMVL